MTLKLVVGLDGDETGQHAMNFAREVAGRLGDCSLHLVHVIEWSPYTFQTPEENAKRHLRRDEELLVAQRDVLDPAVAALAQSNIPATGLAKHGDVAEILLETATEIGAWQIFVGRSSGSRLAKRVFGSASQKLVSLSEIPVTVVG